MKVVDGSNMIVGRVACGVAKKLLQGEEVAVINAEKMVMSGDLAQLTAKYQTKRGMKNKATPENSPNYSRRPDLFVRRIIRGMLPFDSSRGRAAFKRLDVFMGDPGSFDGAEKLEFAGANAEKLNTKYHTIALLCSRLGFKR